MNAIFPWQRELWDYLVKRKETHILPHALLLHGKRGLGKYILARNFAEFLLCEKSDPSNGACGKCRTCILLQADNHPNLIVIQSEEKGRAIKIGQIRTLLQELSTTSHFEGYCVVIVKSAELLNIAAANAFLKTLEEPLAQTLVILVTEYPGLLPLTIRSRCQMLRINTPLRAVAVDWLRQNVTQDNVDVDLALTIAHGSPLRALEMLGIEGELSSYHDFFCGVKDLRYKKIGLAQIVSKCKNWELDDFLLKFIYLVSDIFKLKLGITSGLINYKEADVLSKIAQEINLRSLLTYQDQLYKLRGIILNRIALNQQLLIENLLIGWMKL